MLCLCVLYMDCVKVHRGKICLHIIQDSSNHAPQTPPPPKKQTRKKTMAERLKESTVLNISTRTDPLYPKSCILKDETERV